MEKKNKSNFPVETYISIKKVEHREGNDYYSVSEDKTKIELFEESKKIKNNETINLNANYIFERNPLENAVFFENVCRNSVNEFLNGKRQLILAYGMNKTGKKSNLFGEENSLTNLNHRGIIYRFVEKLLSEVKEKNKKIKDDKLTIYYTFTSNYQSKIIDLINLKINDINTITEEELMKFYENIKLSKDYESSVKKLEIFNIDDFVKNVHQILSIYSRLEHFENKLFSRSNFIMTIQIYNNTGERKSTFTFCTMAASESKSINQIFNIKKTKHSISANADIIAIIELLKLLNKNDISKLKEFFNKNDSFLVGCLKNNFTSECTLKVIGCIFPAPCNQLNVKDTLMIIKRLSNKKADRDDFDKENEEESKDDIIFGLNNKIKSQDKNIEKLKENIFEMKKKMDQSEIEYKSKLDIIKKAFNFEGDINKLLLDDNLLPECKYARQIRDCFSHNYVLSEIIKENESKMKNLKKEKEKIFIEKAVLENDTAMVNMYSKIKDNNELEEKKLRILLEYNNEKDKLRKELDNLRSQNESLKNELNLRNDQFKNLPSILKENVEERVRFGNAKDEIQNYYSNMLKEEGKIVRDKCKKEIEYEKKKLNQIIDEKDELLRIANNKNNKIEYDNNQYLKEIASELVNLHTSLNEVLKEYKQSLDFKKINLNKTPSGMLLKLKDDLDNKLEDIIVQINKRSYPILFKYLNDKNFHCIKSKINYCKSKNTIDKKDKISTENDNNKDKEEKKNAEEKKMNYSINELYEEVFELIGNQNYSELDLENLNNSDLKNIIINLQKKLDKIKEINILLNNSKKSQKVLKNGDKTNNEIENLYFEIEQLKNKLKTQVEISNKYKMILESQQRTISNYKNEQYYKIEKEKIEVKYPTPIIYQVSRPVSKTISNVDFMSDRPKSNISKSEFNGFKINTHQNNNNNTSNTIQNTVNSNQIITSLNNNQITNSSLNHMLPTTSHTRINTAVPNKKVNDNIKLRPSTGIIRPNSSVVTSNIKTNEL